jgi:hypothetical protein
MLRVLQVSGSLLAGDAACYGAALRQEASPTVADAYHGVGVAVCV